MARFSTSPSPHSDHNLNLTATTVPVAGAIAGASAAAAYLDAKFHIRKDIRSIRGEAATEKEFARRSKSCFHYPDNTE
jgi:hypothetical protein